MVKVAFGTAASMVIILTYRYTWFKVTGDSLYTELIPFQQKCWSQTPPSHVGIYPMTGNE